MADTKITALTALTAADPANDVIPIVDVSDPTMAASGTTKKISVNNILGASGTATLASATITGDLTVRTNKLAVTSTGVGIGTTSPSTALDVFGGNIRLVGGNIFQLLNTANDSNVDISNNGSTGVASMLFKVAGTTAMTLNATGLAIGDTAFSGTRLTLRESATNPNALAMTNRNATQTWRIGVDVSAVDDKILGFYDSTSATFRMQLTDTGNVGIGVTPSAWGGAFKAAQLTYGSLYSQAFTVAGVAANCYNAGAGGWTYFGSGQLASRYEQSVGTHAWYTAVAGTGAIGTFTQAMTLDASGSGRLQVGNGTTTVSSVGSVGVSVEGASSNYGRILVAKTSSGSRDSLANYHNGTYIGGVVYSDTATSFPTSSDYRLKEDVKPLVGGLSRVNAIKPSTYKWKLNGSNAEGFIAHELAEVVPDAVMGEKDAVNEDGSIKPQAVDMSKVVPILVAAIQELTARVQTLEAR